MAVDSPALILGDNMSAAFNISLFEMIHNVIAYHHACEGIAAKLLQFSYIKCKETVSDILHSRLVTEVFSSYK